MRRLILLILVGCLPLAGVASAYDENATLRPKATKPIPTLDEGPYNALIASFGGNNQLNESTEGVDWLAM